MMDCMVFLNGHLLEECKDEDEFGKLCEAENQDIIDGKKPTLPAFSYTNIYRWRLDKDGKFGTLRFVESLSANDRIDLVNPRTGHRMAKHTEYGGFYTTWKLEME